jgi:hypothetical protein
MGLMGLMSPTFGRFVAVLQKNVHRCSGVVSGRAPFEPWKEVNLIETRGHLPEGAQGLSPGF